jgi:armadillo repeat-containing protein 8
LVECLNRPPNAQESTTDDIRIEAAHVISSISYGIDSPEQSTINLSLTLLSGSEEAVHSLLQADALRSFLYAISRISPSDTASLKYALARGLRALTSAIADIVGPSQWGLGGDVSDMRSEAKEALDYIFQVRS